MHKLVKIAGARRENYTVTSGCGQNIVCKCQKLRKSEMKSDETVDKRWELGLGTFELPKRR